MTRNTPRPDPASSDRALQGNGRHCAPAHPAAARISTRTLRVDRAHALLEDAAIHYLRTLRSAPEAHAYLRGRGIGTEIAARFGLGYARDDRRGLVDVLRRYAAADVEASGLVARKSDPSPPGEEKSAGFDRFRGRIMFPIRDRAGMLVGFGGRVLNAGDGTAPKYLNSPEGPAFRKRELLYGLFEAASAIEAARSAVVVEG